MIKGSCMCGKVTYVIKGEIGDITHCHCTTCRKAHGSAFSSVEGVQNSVSVKFTNPDAALSAPRNGLPIERG